MDVDGGFWKWVTALLAAVMLGGLPGYIHLYVDSPKRGEVDFIRERQETVLQRLVVLELQIARLQEELKELQGRS